MQKHIFLCCKMLTLLLFHKFGLATFLYNKELPITKDLGAQTSPNTRYSGIENFVDLDIGIMHLKRQPTLTLWNRLNEN